MWTMIDLSKLPDDQKAEINRLCIECLAVLDRRSLAAAKMRARTNHWNGCDWLWALILGYAAGILTAICIGMLQ